MKPFLAELAESVRAKYKSFDHLKIVFPNRRAALYFRKHLSAILAKPAFAPSLVTIEDYFAGLSDLKIPDKLELIHRLYLAYNKVVVDSSRIRSFEPEPFHQFYFWGDMLLRDFDETDKYMVAASQLFRDLRDQKELDSSFDYLTDEQRKFLISFWGSFEVNITENKRKFLNVWNQLHLLYETFKEDLLTHGLAYEGMLQRSVAERISSLVQQPHSPVLFVGFNALTAAEEKLISHHVALGIGEVYWDVDSYYVNDNKQEAGKFFREYQQHRVLGKTFQDDLPANLKSSLTSATTSDGKSEGTKSFKVFGAAQPVGQTKMLGQILKQHLESGMHPEETLIVLPDENLLLPVLHSVSGYVEKLNVTMGFPIGSTPVYNLAELLVELQINRRDEEFNHRQVLALLGHPYLIAEDAGESNIKRKEILNKNWIYVPAGYLASQTILHRLIFNPLHNNIVDYLRDVLTAVGNLKTVSGFDREYLFHFIKLLNRISEIAGDSYNVSATRISSKDQTKALNVSLRSFLRLFRQLVQTHKIPFSGEPLKGLQVMGVLETRNLDFKNVFILSLNEGSFPSFGSKSSYIPFSIRRAYGLPTAEHQDAMYAYLFYRVLQRAENVFLFYNTETDDLGQGESSRYLKQLIYESGIDLETKILHDPVQPLSIGSIVVEKDQRVMETLARLSEVNGAFGGISPSALNTYIECRLRFYFRHIARIKEPDTVEEDLDARVLGNLLHEVMEHFYKDIIQKKKSQEIDKADFKDAETRVDLLIDKVFIEAYDLQRDKVVTYEGQRLVVREIVKRFAHRIVEMDRLYAPFKIELLEQGGLDYSIAINHPPGIVKVMGKIDRVDRKGNVVRVIDYKTGKDKLDIDDMASLFSRSSKRNKAAFQTFLYALLYQANGKKPSDKVVPGLINRMNLFDQDFKFGFTMDKGNIDDVGPFLPEFENKLQLLLEELFDPQVPFDQTEETDTCKYCPYHRICYR